MPGVSTSARASVFEETLRTVMLSGITPFVIKAVRIRDTDNPQTEDGRASDATRTFDIEAHAAATTVAVARAGERRAEVHRTGY